jgi:hypothetical protein
MGRAARATERRRDAAQLDSDLHPERVCWPCNACDGTEWDHICCPAWQQAIARRDAALERMEAGK